MRKKRLCRILTYILLASCLTGCGGGSGREDVAADTGAEQTAAAVEAEASEEAAAEETRTDTAENVAADVPEDAEQAVQDDALRGLGLSIVGDSISTYSDWQPYGFNTYYPAKGILEDVTLTWWIMLLDDTGMELCTNNSSAGSTCAGDSTAEDIQVGCSSFRLSFMTDTHGRMPDIIIVYMGTNDLLDAVPLGENDGTMMVEEGEVKTFGDAYSMMLDKLSSDYPAAQIYCCTLTQVGDWGKTEAQPFVPFTNSLGLTAADYSERIRLIAENKGMQVVDLYNCGIDTCNLSALTVDGVHPKPEGMQYIEAAMLAALRGGTDME